MLTTLRTNGQIQLCCEWWLVNDLGTQDWTHGKYVWVEQLEISKGYEGKSLITQLIEQIANTVPQAVGAYWLRRDKTGPQKLHAFRRKRLLEVTV